MPQQQLHLFVSSVALAVEAQRETQCSGMWLLWQPAHGLYAAGRERAGQYIKCQQGVLRSTKLAPVYIAKGDLASLGAMSCHSK